MQVQDLIKKINNKTFNLEKSLEVKKYIPIMNKKMFVMDVIAECTDVLDDFITIDRFKMNIYFDMKVLATYTNLEIADDFYEAVTQYDMLCESGVMNQVIALFKDDYDAMCKVLEDEMDELLRQNTIDAQVVKIANKINSVIDVVGDKLSGVDLNSMLPEGTDINDLINMVNMLK